MRQGEKLIGQKDQGGKEFLETVVLRLEAGLDPRPQTYLAGETLRPEMAKC